MKSKILNLIQENRGFSLIELMIVVAIIGVLASIAVPNYTSLKNRARESQAKSLLSGLFTAEKIFFGEWTQYYGDWRNIGFSIDGIISFRVGFQLTSGNPSPGVPAGYNGPGLPAGSNAVNVNPNPAAFNCGPPPLPCEELAGKTCGLTHAVHRWEVDSFVAAACGRFTDHNGVVSDQHWSINEEKKLRNTIVP